MVIRKEGNATNVYCDYCNHNYYSGPPNDRYAGCPSTCWKCGRHECGNHCDWNLIYLFKGVMNSRFKNEVSLFSLGSDPCPEYTRSNGGKFSPFVCHQCSNTSWAEQKKIEATEIKKQLDEIIRKEDEIERIEYEKKRKIAELRANPCKICNEELGTLDCPDCDRKIGVNCWDKELAICHACKKKIMLLKGGSTPQASPQPSQQTIVSNEERYDTLRNLLKMSPEVPFSYATSSLSFASENELIKWISVEGFPGINIDFGAQKVKLTNEDAFTEYVEALLE